MQTQPQYEGVIVDLTDFLDLIAESDSCDRDRQGELNIWRAEHPVLGQITGIQGAMPGVLIFSEKLTTHS